MPNQYINKVIYGGNTLIDLTSDTIDASHLLYGYTAHSKSGASITGECTYDSDTTDADAVASEILYGKTAYVNKTKLTGGMANRGATTAALSTKSEQWTIPAGYHDGSGKVSIDATEQGKIIAGNIKSGVTILGVTGDYSGETVTAAASTATPSTATQTILPPTGYDYLSQVTVKPIPYTETDNAAGGKTVTIG